ncbi:MAG TPA: efflux RND transporter periplasmic adaptor subunit [Candidatus Deferrimicrobium sp.]|nr:efflux RND transporter periplasmic adaptor subunit [Candidatus Deferrimicrobium sp.]
MTFCFFRKPLCLAFIVFACLSSGVLAGESASGSDKGLDIHKPHGQQESVIRLTQAEMDEFGVQVGIASAGILHQQIIVPGEIVLDGDHVAHITPRFPGIVKEVRKQIGDEVKQGEVLAIIESNEGLTPYEVKSLLTGSVIEKHISVGENSSAEETAFLVANLDTVWVNLSIYQMNLPDVRVGQRVEILTGFGVPDATVTIAYVAPIVDESTRIATARVVLPNRDGKWRPGLFVEGRISVRDITVPLVVPKTAIQTIDGQPAVFVETENGFVPQLVSLGRSDGWSVEITAGLRVGDSFVTTGGFTLKAELMKSSFGDEH